MTLTTSPATTGRDIAATTDDIAIRISGLQKTFRRHGGVTVPAIDNISLDIAAGEMIVLLGPSGCGKTTLLRCIAGLEEPDSGEIVINGKVHYSSAQQVNRAPNKRKISMMFQSYALWPHMTVGQNVDYPLHRSGLSRTERQQRVEHMLDLVGLPGLARQYPSQLSGGQQQRVALARSLVTDPAVILFDEPLSNVDAKVREELRVELMTKQEELGFTGVYVTHDQEEAMQLADRLAVLDRGRIAQIDKPVNVYQSPSSIGVARFVGSLNEIPGTVRGVGRDGIVVETPLGSLRGRAANGTSQPHAVGDKVIAAMRAEAVRAARPNASRSDGHNHLSATLIADGFAGAHSVRVFEAGGLSITSHGPARASGELKHGELADLSFDPDDVMVFRP